jgi:hypothetical protein
VPAKKSIPKPPPWSPKVNNFMLGLELASNVMMVLDYGLDHSDAKQLATDSRKAAAALTSLHLQDFTAAKAPIAPSAPRRLPRLGRVDQSEQTHLTAAYEENLDRWQLLCDHDANEVITSVDGALADNASPSTCVDAGHTPRNYVSIVVQYPGPEITEGVVQVGRKTRPRNEAEKIDLYRNAVASTVIATAKEALSLAPAAYEARILVLRYDLRGHFTKRASQLDAIYVGALDRNILDVDWSHNNPADAVLHARDVLINLDHKGRFKPLGTSVGDDLHQLIDAIGAAAASSTTQRSRRTRFTREQSAKLISSQERERFVGICDCPGCGEFDAHALQPATIGDPLWARVIRTCSTCNRQWAQA